MNYNNNNNYNNDNNDNDSYNDNNNKRDNVTRENGEYTANLRGVDAFVRDEKTGQPDKTAINHVFRPCRNVLND